MRQDVKHTLFGCAILLVFAVVLNTSALARDHAPRRDISPRHIHNAVPKAEKKSASGNPSSYVVRGKRYFVRDTSHNYDTVGIASWYGMKFQGRPTSSGEPYNVYAMTAAHKTLPLPTYAKVKNLENGREIIVKINDRGPFHEDRIIDLSYAAAKKLGIAKKGTGLVEVKAITDPSSTQPRGHFNAHQAISTDSTFNTIQSYLQIGAYQSVVSAKQLAKKIANLSASRTVVKRIVVRSRPIYRVQMGPFSTDYQRIHAANNLKKLGIAPIVTINS